MELQSGGGHALRPEDRERIARATRAALRALLGRLQTTLADLEGRAEPWPAKWAALKLSARRALEREEAVGTALAVITVETARALLQEMGRLEQAGVGAEESWTAVRRWLATRAVLHD